MADSYIPSIILPYSIIRNEKDPIHAVALGSPVFSLFPDFDPASSLTSETSPGSDRYNNKEANSSGFSAQQSHQKVPWGLGKAPELVSAPVDRYGIFDSSSDDDIIEEDPESAFMEKEQSAASPHPALVHENPAFPHLHGSESLLYSSSSPLLTYLGTSTGSIGIYESGTGRLLDRIPGAHGRSSVLLIVELISQSDHVIFVSQGRDGYVRFWCIKPEDGEADFPTLPELTLARKRLVAKPHASPVFVGGEGFCRSSFCKEESLVASVVDRGSIAIWSYADVIQAVGAHGDTSLVPRCVVCYEGDVHGMCMSLQLVPTTKAQPTALVAGFEDGSLLAWSLTPVAPTTPSTSSHAYLFYQNVASLRPFTTTPVLSIALRTMDELLLHQQPTPPSHNAPSPMPLHQFDISNRLHVWIGVCTSSEEDIVLFGLEWSLDVQHDGTHSAKMLILERWNAPHKGFQDVKIREDSLVAIAGWDHRIRLFLLDAIEPSTLTKSTTSTVNSTNTATTHITFQLRPLTILKHHLASIQAIALGDASSRLLVSASSDQRAALWHVY